MSSAEKEGRITTVSNTYFDEAIEFSDDDEDQDVELNDEEGEEIEQPGLLTTTHNKPPKKAIEEASTDGEDLPHTKLGSKMSNPAKNRGDSPPSNNLSESEDEYDHGDDDDEDYTDDALSSAKGVAVAGMERTTQGIASARPGAAASGQTRRGQESSMTTLDGGRKTALMMQNEDDDLLTGDDDGDLESANEFQGRSSSFPTFKEGGAEDIKELFQYIARYRPQEVELEPELKPFIPDYIPAIGDIDAFIKISRPDQKPDSLGLTVLDEPAGKQSDPTVLDLHLRAVTKSIGPVPQNIRSLDSSTLRSNPKPLEHWIRDVKDLHTAKPPPSVHYSRRMPDIEELMQVWPPEIEEALSTLTLPGPDIEMPLIGYARLVTSILDIPMAASTSEKDKDGKHHHHHHHHHHKDSKRPRPSTAAIESLHVLFTLFSEFKNSQHFRSFGVGMGMPGNQESSNSLDSDGGYVAVLAYGQTLDEMDFERSLHGACQSGNIARAAKILSKSSALVNEYDKHGYTPLHLAARQGHLEICRMLLDYGADVNAKTCSLGSTALFRACVGGHLDVAKLLLKNHADRNIVCDNDGRSCLQIAQESNFSDLVSLLQGQ